MSDNTPPGRNTGRTHTLQILGTPLDLANGAFGYRNCGEKSVNTMNVESTFSTSFPLASDFSFTLFHSGSS
jgi:hypothetical protein